MSPQEKTQLQEMNEILVELRTNQAHGLGQLKELHDTVCDPQDGLVIKVDRNTQSRKRISWLGMAIGGVTIGLLAEKAWALIAG